MTFSIRKKGFIKLIVGLLALIAISYFIYWLWIQTYIPNSFALISLGVPIALGLVGLLEVLMNRPFSDIETRWNGLKSWQRGILGFLVVVITFSILIAGMATENILGII